MDYLGWANSHGIEILIGWYILSAIVSSLPSPRKDANSNLYRFFFTFLHTLAGSIGRIPYLRNITDGTSPTMQTTTQTATLVTTEPVPSALQDPSGITQKKIMVTTLEPGPKPPEKVV